ncbi:2OG-Fe(II) oxygenase [Maricaulis parjimensis]|uniref:2OG-Fe(II) oxygenase n=1 Tax=Maricaulis parjimensis TaxID=144023 RepID=UPI00193AD164|nr:2OG-Fe(II) oxygenase [Maricaulis parjimensis]
MSLIALADTTGLPVFDAQNVCADLSQQGWSLCRLADSELLAALRSEAETLWQADILTPAGIGRAEDHDIVRKIRRDLTHWMDGSTPAQAGYLAFAEAVRREVNYRLMLGLFAFEAHYAVYEPGGFYKRHVDSFRGARNRMLSSVLYLNPDWDPSDGGLLRIYAPDSEDVIAEITPEFGTLALFLSEDIPHEVTPARRDRFSIAGWHRCNDRGLVPALQVKGLPVA